MSGRQKGVIRRGRERRHLLYDGLELSNPIINNRYTAGIHEANRGRVERGRRRMDKTMGRGKRT